MGVYIKGMKKPSSCVDCILYKSCEKHHCELKQDEEGYWTPVWVAEDCPMIEIKPLHTKLVEFIEADTFTDDDTGTEETTFGDILQAYYAMKNADPIIDDITIDWGIDDED